MNTQAMKCALMSFYFYSYVQVKLQCCLILIIVYQTKTDKLWWLRCNTGRFWRLRLGQKDWKYADWLSLESNLPDLLFFTCCIPKMSSLSAVFPGSLVLALGNLRVVNIVLCVLWFSAFVPLQRCAVMFYSITQFSKSAILKLFLKDDQVLNLLQLPAARGACLVNWHGWLNSADACLS